jgi:hypothetical protein
MVRPWKVGKSLYFPVEISFDEKYPELKDIRVEYEERGAFGDPGIVEPVKDGFSFRDFGPRVRCKNPECGFGYDFETIADAMVADAAKPREGRMQCSGVGKTIGQRMGRTCVNRITYVVTLFPKAK